MQRCISRIFSKETCEKCESGEEESEEHMMVCTGWEEERGSLDMLRIMDQVEFFIKVGKVKTIK